MKYPVYPEYRATSNTALPQLPAHWQIKRLRFATTGIEQGWSPQCDNEVADDDRWGVMKVGCVNGDQFDPLENKALPAALDPIPAYELQPGDVLVSRANTKELVGSAAVVPEGVRPRLLLCDKLFRIRPQDEVQARFLTYVLRTPAARHHYERDATGASGSMQNIGQDTLKNLCVPLPPGDEQSAITAFLDWRTVQIDALIGKKEALLNRLSERRLALVTAHTLEDRRGNSGLATNKHIQFGIPSHWAWHRMKFTAAEPLKYGANEPADLIDPTCPRYIRITDIRDDGTLHEDTFRSLPEDVARPYLLSENDILLARSGATVGKSFRYLDTWGRAAYAGYLIRFRVDANILLPKFASLALQSAYYWSMVEANLVQATIQNFSAEKYGSLLIPLPPIEEQALVVERLEKLCAQIDNAHRRTAEALDRLTEYRSALITAAVTGQIDVRGVPVPATA